MVWNVEVAALTDVRPLYLPTLAALWLAAANSAISLDYVHSLTSPVLHCFTKTGALDCPPDDFISGALAMSRKLKHLNCGALLIVLSCCSLLSSMAQSSSREQEISAQSVQEGLKYFNEGKYGEAAKSFQKATESEPDNSFAYYAMALSLANLKRYGSALEPLRHGLKLNPHPHWGNITEEMVRSFLKETERNARLSKQSDEQPLRNTEDPVVNQSDQSTAKIEGSVFADAVGCFHKLRNGVGLGISFY